MTLIIASKINAAGCGKHRSEQNNKGNRRLDVSETCMSANPTFQKVGISSRICSQICFSLLIVDREMFLAVEWMLTFDQEILLAAEWRPLRFSEVRLAAE